MILLIIVVHLRDMYSSEWNLTAHLLRFISMSKIKMHKMFVEKQSFHYQTFVSRYRGLVCRCDCPFNRLN